MALPHGGVNLAKALCNVFLHEQKRLLVHARWYGSVTSSCAFFHGGVALGWSRTPLGCIRLAEERVELHFGWRSRTPLALTMGRRNRRLGGESAPARPQPGNRFVAFVRVCARLDNIAAAGARSIWLFRVGALWLFSVVFSCFWLF